MLGATWELYGRHVWDEARKDGPKDFTNGGSEALLWTILGTLVVTWQCFGPTLGASEVTWGSLWVSLGSFVVTLDDQVTK